MNDVAMFSGMVMVKKGLIGVMMDEKLEEIDQLQTAVGTIIAHALSCGVPKDYIHRMVDFVDKQVREKVKASS